MPLDFRIYSDEYIGLTDPQGLPTLEVSWWGFESEPGMDAILLRAGASLQSMIDRLQIYPVIGPVDGQRLFMAQFSIQQDGEMVLNFIAGFQIDCIEMMVLIGEYSSLADNVAVKPGRKGVPPAPTNIFEWPESDRILLNKIYSTQKNEQSGLTAKMFADSLGNERPKSHWWFRSTFSAEQSDQRKFPVPGEFVGLGVRIMVDKPWGSQLSSPFLYSGNWADSVFYTSGVVKEVTPPSDTVPYPTYQVQWRGQVVTAIPSDFASYQVGDRVTILKSVDATKTEQTWMDDDALDGAKSNFDDGTWVLVPINFFDDGTGVGL